MIEALLWGIVLFLLIDKLFFNQKDKLARKALEKLAEESNLRVEYYPFSGDVGIYPKSYIDDFKKRMEEIDREMNLLNTCRKMVDGEISELRKAAIAGDEKVVEGVNALAKHLGVKITQYHKPEENGLKVEKIKKIRK